MFNATDIRLRAKHPTRLESYFKRDGYTAIRKGLLLDNVPASEIIKTVRGPGGSTYLHDAFFVDFACWLGGEVYYRVTRRFVSYPNLSPRP